MLAFVFSRWRESFRLPRFNLLFFGGILVLGTCIYFFADFLEFIQNRKGFVINDPLIIRVGPYHLCTPIMLFTYIPAGVGIIYFAVFPNHFNRLLWAFSFLLVLRGVCMFFVPLAPPHTMIELRDLFLELSVYRGKVITQDLFFSGHVAALFLFGFIAHHKVVKLAFALAGLAVGSMLVLQHAHYTIDVLVAPVFALFAVRLSRQLF
jgi:hypothetical protein